MILQKVICTLLYIILYYYNKKINILKNHFYSNLSWKILAYISDSGFTLIEYTVNAHNVYWFTVTINFNFNSVFEGFVLVVEERRLLWET